MSAKTRLKARQEEEPSPPPPPRQVLFGHPQKMDDRPSCLPTYSDVMKHYYFESDQLKKASKCDPPGSKVAKNTAEKVMNIWERASLPVLSLPRVVKMISVYQQSCRALVKSKRRNSASQSLKEEIFVKEAKAKLFDICSCKCPDRVNNCSCELSRKVPQREIRFLVDQRTRRQMKIGGVDETVTSKIRKRQEKQEGHGGQKHGIKSSVPRKRAKKETSSSAENTKTSGTGTGTDTETGTDREFEPQPSTSGQNRLHLDRVASAAYRTGASRRGVALVVTAALEDASVISSHDTTNVVDKSKISRAMKRLERKIAEECENEVNLQRLYFDGKKDLTFAKERKGDRFYQKDVVEEHICLVNEPGSEYLGHVTPKSGSSGDISSSIQDFVKSHYETRTLEVIGSDGTVVDIGRKSGIMTRIEGFVKRALQRVVCLLHFNELPLRNLMTHLDGPTKGPKGTSGPIGKAILKCEEMPVKTFEAIPVDWITGMVAKMETVHDLSWDQKLLLKMCSAVSNGNCPQDVAAMKPPPLSQARWLTTAMRILRYYMAESNPSVKLRQLSEFVMRVYAPSWFSIKSAPSLAEGAKHLWGVIERSRYLPDDLRKIVDEVIQHNAFFAHPENLLVAMVSDPNPETRALGWRRIKKARAKTSKLKKIREFVVPLLNERATNYVEMIDWQTCAMTEPPLTTTIPDEDIDDNIEQSALFERAFQYPCHTQSVERMIRLVSEASGKVFGQEARDGYIKAKLESRKKLPVFNTKSQYAPEQT